MKCMSIVLLTLYASLLLHGCRHHEDTNVVEARRRLREFQTSLKVWNPTVRLRDGIGGTIGGWISCVSNASHRTELAQELADILLSVNLTNQPYLVVSPEGWRLRPRENAVVFYKDYAYPVCLIMRDNGCPPESVMEFFFAALLKYKTACFSIPLEFRQMKGESREVFPVRINCAMLGQDSYARTMTEIRKIVLPYLSNYRPPELHYEFRRRIKPFFDFPSKEEFYEIIHPGVKYLCPSPESPDSKAPTTNNPEEDIEVDI